MAVAARTAAHRVEAALATMDPEAVLEHKIAARYDPAKFWSGEGDQRPEERPKALEAKMA